MATLVLQGTKQENFSVRVWTGTWNGTAGL